jgi:glyoxylase-like metal-dependent hydrolase (beta-lactamase superfamily II)
MKIDRISADVLRLALGPFGAVNAYVLDDILVDSGDKFSRRRLLSALSDIPISGHVITHAHFDHQGCSHAVCEQFDVPLMCGEGDRAAVETGDLTQVLPSRDSWIARLSRRVAGPGHPVARPLSEGHQLGCACERVWSERCESS